ncbi:hypothetical protein ACVJF0_007498 [Bradyrhizobium elkanii]
MVDELRLASPGRVIETEFAIHEPVNCDRIRIGQLLSNLLGNAVTHGATDKPVVVHAETRKGSFELWVANAGEAIPETVMEKLFEPFFRGKARASKQVGALHRLSDRKGPWGRFDRRIELRWNPLHLLYASFVACQHWPCPAGGTSSIHHQDAAIILRGRAPKPLADGRDR